MAKKRRFEIDFFEFSFLVEACIPERPIARTMFWHNVIDKYYHELTDDERARLFEFKSLDPIVGEALNRCAFDGDLDTARALAKAYLN